MESDKLSFPMYSDPIWKTFRGEYINRFVYNNQLLSIGDWVEFLTDKDLGVSYEDTVKVSNVDYNRVYTVTDKNKWLLTCIKYGITLQ